MPLNPNISRFIQTRWKTILTVGNCLLVTYVLYLVFFSGEFRFGKTNKELSPPKQTESQPEPVRFQDVAACDSYDEVMQSLRQFKPADASELELLMHYLQHRDYRKYEVTIVQEYDLLSYGLGRLIYASFDEDDAGDRVDANAFLVSQIPNSNHHRLIQDLYLQAWLIGIKQQTLNSSEENPDPTLHYQAYSELVSAWSIEQHVYHRNSCMGFLLEMSNTYPDSLWHSALQQLLDTVARNPVGEEVATTTALNHFARTPNPLGRSFAAICLQQELTPRLKQQALRTYRICSTNSDAPFNASGIVAIDAQTELELLRAKE